jgi:hypothetical protein
MSAPQRFATVAAALEAFAAGQCRRWVSVEGHQIDLVQAQAEAGRVKEEPPDLRLSGERVRHGGDYVRDHDASVARRVAAELARAAAPVELPPLAEPALPAPPPDDASAYRCPWCSRCCR